MKNLLLILALVLFFNIIRAQKTYYDPVIVYSLTENTIVKKNGREIKLDSLLVCHYNESLEVIKGSVRLFSGDDEELELNSGKQIFVKKGNSLTSNSKAAVINKISRFINEPSVYLPNLYSAERNHLAIFPLESNVYNSSNIKLHFPKKRNSKVKFKLYYNKDSVVWQTNNFINNEIPQNLNLSRGINYFWRLYIGDIGTRGEFTIMSDEQIKEINITKPKNKADYLNSYFIYLENDCKFDAIATLIKANRKYPNCKILKSIKSKVSVTIEQ